jgi:hypothetical protein
MHRLIVSLLAALDAAVVVAIGLLLALVPLTILWIVAFGGAADWSALWPSAASIWLLGNLVPLQIALPETLTIALGIAGDASSFTLSLAPLALAALAAAMGARSGARAARAGSWLSGFAGGAVTTAALATAVGLTAENDVVVHELWHAIVFPTAIYAGAVLLGGVVTAWRVGDGFVIDRLRSSLARFAPAWREVVPLIARGFAVAIATIVGIGALLTALSVILHGDRIVTLFQAAHVDALGATLVTLGQAAYLPTLIGWAIAWVAGPGFALGAGTVVSPVGAQLGVVPAIPILGALPETGEPWFLVVVLLPIAAGGLAGWVCRSSLARAGLDQRTSPRLVIALGIALLVGGAGALIALVSSGSAGPGALVQVGPEPGPLALALGVEVLLGAAVALLTPLGRDERGASGASGALDASDASDAPDAARRALVSPADVTGAQAQPSASEQAPPRR